MMKLPRITATAFLCLLLTNPAWAGFPEALTAWKSGDYATALREFKPLAHQGNTSAQYNLGVIYANGRGVARNDVEAVKWYSKAAEKGNAQAQYALGLMYGHGRGVPKDYTKAANLWHPLAEAGDHNAQYALGIMYGNGNGVPQDYRHAYKWFNLSATKGHKLAKAARETLAIRMTPADVAEAQKLTRAWLESRRQNPIK
jgi:TPR repeat protein